MVFPSLHSPADHPRSLDSNTEAPDFQVLFEDAPGCFLVLDPRLRIVAVSDAYLKATMTERKAIMGRHLFEVFPDNPDDPSADGVTNLTASLDRVARNHVPDTMAIQQYDIRQPLDQGGGFEVRYWSPLNSPVLGADGELRYIIHKVEDVTEKVRSARELEAARISQEISEERDRIARDLHDFVIQRLFASGMTLASVFNRMSASEFSEAISRVIDDLDDTISEIRSAIFALGHGSRSAGGFRRQLLEVVSRAGKALGFQPRVHFVGPVDSIITPAMAEHILAVAQEALSNVARHAHASNAQVVVRAAEDVVLEVTDDGKGIGVVTRRSGLANMECRATTFGGTLSVTSDNGSGTRLEWRIPVPIGETPAGS